MSASSHPKHGYYKSWTRGSPISWMRNETASALIFFRISCDVFIICRCKCGIATHIKNCMEVGFRSRTEAPSIYPQYWASKRKFFTWICFYFGCLLLRQIEEVCSTENRSSPLQSFMIVVSWLTIILLGWLSKQIGEPGYNSADSTWFVVSFVVPFRFLTRWRVCL